MKLFQRKNNININSVSIPTFDWTNIKSDDSTLVWVNNNNTVALSLNYFNLRPDLPTIKNLETIRSFYRTRVSQAGGGIIETDLISIDGIPSVKTLFKFPGQSNGITYVGCITIPFEKQSYVIKIQAIESGVTGIRESVVANTLIRENLLAFGEGQIEGWAADPYEATFTTGRLMNKSEEPQFDYQFPDHPLSKVRALLSEIELNIKFVPGVEHLSRFKK